MLEAIGWLIVIGLSVLAFMFVSAGLGALIGNALAAVRRAFALRPPSGE